MPLFCITCLYYLHHKESVSSYLANWLAWSHQMREEQRRNPPPFIEKLRRLKAEKEAADDRCTRIDKLIS